MSDQRELGRTMGWFDRAAYRFFWSLLWIICMGSNVGGSRAATRGSAQAVK